MSLATTSECTESNIGRNAIQCVPRVVVPSITVGSANVLYDQLNKFTLSHKPSLSDMYLN
jgi:hypothetical protein